MAQTLVTWESLEFIQKERSGDWYWILGIVTVAGFLVAFFLENFLFAIFIIIGSFTLYLYAKKEPDMVTFSLTDHGMVMGKTLHPYQNFESFWIDTSDEQWPVLRLMPDRTLALPTAIPLGDVDLDAVHNILSEKLEEEEQYPGLVEHLMGALHF